MRNQKKTIPPRRDGLNIYSNIFSLRRHYPDQVWWV